MAEKLFSNKNFFFSESIKRIDLTVGFKYQILKKIIKIRNYLNKSKSKNIVPFQSQNSKIKSKIKEHILNNKKSKDKTQNESQMLPRTRPFIQNIDKYLKRANKTRNKFKFKDISKTSKKDKPIIIKKIKIKQLNEKDEKEKKKPKQKKGTNNNIDSNNCSKNEDIFDANYKYEVKKSKEFIILKQRLKRIIDKNIKDEKKINLNRTFSLNLKNKIGKKNIINYGSIDKHKRDIYLNDNLRRIFPDNLIKKSYYKENELMSYSTINKDIKINKYNNIGSAKKRNRFYICSSLSFDNKYSKSSLNHESYEQSVLIEGKRNIKLSNTFYKDKITNIY